MSVAAEFDQEFRLAERAMKRKINTFVSNNVHKVPGQAMSPEDLRAEMMIVLWKAVKSYNPDRGAKFNTHFWTCWNNKFRTILRAGSTDKRKANVHVETLNYDEVAAAVERRLEQPSAEDEVISGIMIYDRVRKMANPEPELSEEDQAERQAYFDSLVAFERERREAELVSEICA